MTTHDRPDDRPRDEPWWDDLDARAHVPGPEENGDGRNLPYEVRVVLVGAVWTLPGVLAGLMANLAFPVTADPSIAAAAGGVVVAFAGGWLEAAG